MGLSHIKPQLTSAWPQRLGWLSFVGALGANVLLFYVLALARTKPSLAYIDEPETMRMISLNLPVQSEAEPVGKDLDPGVFRAAPKQSRSLSIQPVAYTLPVLLPRISDWPSDPDLPGLPVTLPRRFDGEVAQQASLPGADAPLSILKVDRIPSKTTGAPPRYPQWARRAGLEGVVTLRFVVTADGTVEDIRIHDVEGDERFAREAIRAIAKWRFEPALKGGQHVACWCFQKVNFKLGN